MANRQLQKVGCSSPSPTVRVQASDGSTCLCTILPAQQHRPVCRAAQTRTGGQDQRQRLLSVPPSAPPSPCPGMTFCPIWKGRNTGSSSTHRHRHCVAASRRWGPALARCLPSKSANGLLLMLKMPYGTFYDNSVSGMFILPTLRSTGLAAKSRLLRLGKSDRVNKFSSTSRRQLLTTIAPPTVGGEYCAPLVTIHLFTSAHILQWGKTRYVITRSGESPANATLLFKRAWGYFIHFWKVKYSSESTELSTV